ncbi:glycosyltransferase [Herbiconiux liukaitaii]|uniref:glycosyltransferase n=1 Tax=Herbiconiux liukaitaii TaxID=3342799 RepID=UPI0035B9673A
MHARVTAVLVASNGADHLPRTLEAIAAQTRAPDALVVVDCASTDASSSLLAAAQPTRFISESSRLSFGTAIQHALGVAPPPESENEWLWLLAHDTAPEPDALAALLAAVEVNPSVAAAGPKQMEWSDRNYIAEFGETITSLGASVPIVETELDQAQHDRLSDVLGMGAAGLLVRHTVWNEVGGFDPALPTADNALDFSIRVRLAGHRVMAVPAARVATDGDGFSDPGRSTRGSVRRKRQTARRAAQLHRRLVYAPPFAVVFHWLSLVPLAIARSLFQLVRKQPGAIGGEFAAAFKTAFGSRIGEARKRLKASKRVGWKAIAPLRMPGDEIRRRRSLQREIALTYLRGARDRIQFISSGGVVTVLVALLVGLVAFIPVFGASAITGGGALPLDPTAGGLWAQIGTGFRDTGLGFVGAADPFAAVIAVIGSLTFWSPSLAIVGLYLLALPLAALAGWFLAAHLTERPLLRSVAAVLWVVAPPFLGALDSGQIGAILAHLLLPWLVLAVLAAPRSWSASAMASILFAAVLAVSPSLLPALVLLWIVATVASRRNVMRLIGIPIPALALFGPLIIDQIERGTPLALLADPGLPVARDQVPVLELLLGLPKTGLGGWESLAGGVGIDSGAVLVVVAVLTVPLGLLALAALVLPGSYRPVISMVIAIVGFATAVLAGQLALATSSAEAVTIWPGSGLSLYWLGLSGAAVFGLAALPRFTGVPAVVATIAVGVLALPMGLGVLLGTAQVVPGDGRELPAYVTAESATNPRVGTLRLVPQADGALGATVVHGAGPTLSQQSTLASTADYAAEAGGGSAGSRAASGAGADELSNRAEIAEIVGNAASISGAEVSERLTALGIEFVLLEPAAETDPSASDASSSASQAIVSRTTSALNSNAQLTFIGDTFAGALWQVSGDGTLATLQAPTPTNTGTPFGVLVLVVQAFVFGIALLLALPAGRLQVQGSRAVSGTAHVASADSAEEQLAEEKGTEHDDRVAVGEEPESLDTPDGVAADAGRDEPVRDEPGRDEPGRAGAGARPTPGHPELPEAAPSAAIAAAVLASRQHGAESDQATDSEPVPSEADSVAPGQPVAAAEPVKTAAGTYAAEYVTDERPSTEPEAQPAPAPSSAPDDVLFVEPAPEGEGEPVSDSPHPQENAEPVVFIEPEPAPEPEPEPEPAAESAPAAEESSTAAGYDDYDPNDETVLSIREALDRQAAEQAGFHVGRPTTGTGTTGSGTQAPDAPRTPTPEEGPTDGR